MCALRRHARTTSRPFRQDFANEDLPLSCKRTCWWCTWAQWSQLVLAHATIMSRHDVKTVFETRRQGASERSRKQFRQTVERIVHHLQPPDASQPSRSLFNIEGLQRCTTGKPLESNTGWWLTYPSEKYESQLGWLFPIYGKIKNVPNHQPATLIRGMGHCFSATAMRVLVQDFLHPQYDVGYSNSIL